MGKLTVSYWAVRGLGEPIRMMLEYSEEDYENKLYHIEKSSEWFDNKFKLGLDFPNLPYMIDGDIKITESQAIVRYVARKCGLVPTDPKSLAECEMAESVVVGIRSKFTESCYKPDFDKAKLREAVLPSFPALEKFLGSRPYLAGNDLSYVDFQLYETMDHHRLLYPDILDEFPNIKKFMERFASQKTIAAYFKSNRYSLFPINGPMAKWGGQNKAD